MLIRSQDGLTIVQTKSVWAQHSVDKTKLYIFAATEFDPEGVCLAERNTVAEAQLVIQRVLDNAEQGYATDLCEARDDSETSQLVVEITTGCLKKAFEDLIRKHKEQDMPVGSTDERELGYEPSQECPHCYTAMKVGECGKYCPKCGVTV